MGLEGIIRVLIVEDSPLVCKILTNIINSEPKLLVVGTAADGIEAVKLVPRLRPNIITMDIKLPHMNGLEATKEIMAYNPTPILIISSSILKGSRENAFKAISYGALDVVEKGVLESKPDENAGYELIHKIKFLAGVKVIHHPLAKLERHDETIIEIPRMDIPHQIIAIAASTGGPVTILKILKRIPKEFPTGIVIVQHISRGFTDGLAEWLNDECQITVKTAEDSEVIRPGTAYIAPNDLQMRIKKGERISLTDEPPLNGHRPSGDILMESVGKVYKDKATGIILTGMGRDGASGMKVIKEYHGNTIAQDEESSIIFGMPKAAIDMNIVDKVLSIDEIANEVVKGVV